MTTWVKIDDDLPWNRKVTLVTVPARWAYVASICYAGRGLTDGYVPRTALDLLPATAKIAAELVRAGLWEVGDGGWMIHDYSQHNRTREQVDAIKEKAAQNGAKGLAKRYGKLPSKPLGESLCEPPSNPLSEPPSRTRDLYLSPVGSTGDLSPDPRESRESRASKRPSELLAIRKTVPDDEWVEQMREKYSPQLRDFTETLQFFAQGPYYRRHDDKCGFLEKKLAAAVEREREQRRGNAGLAAIRAPEPERQWQSEDASKPGYIPSTALFFGDDE